MSTKEILKNIIDVLWELEAIEEVEDLSRKLINDISASTQAIVNLKQKTSSVKHKFKVGDRVKVIKILDNSGLDDIARYKYHTGFVVKAYVDVWAQDLEVKMDIDDMTIYLKEQEVELMPI